MPYDFCFVSRDEYLPAKKDLIELILDVQNEVRDLFTFQFTFVGSAGRKMITKDRRGNRGYDFDVNLHIHDDEEEYTATEIRNIIRSAFARHMAGYGYNRCEDSTRVITIKRIDFLWSRILYSCDIGIVYDCNNGRQQYIHFDKKQQSYYWEYLPISSDELENRAELIRKKGHWDEVKDRYIDKKNWNVDDSKKSRSLYAEAVNEVYLKYNKGQRVKAK